MDGRTNIRRRMEGRKAARKGGGVSGGLNVLENLCRVGRFSVNTLETFSLRRFLPAATGTVSCIGALRC